GCGLGRGPAGDDGGHGRRSAEEAVCGPGHARRRRHGRNGLLVSIRPKRHGNLHKGAAQAAPFVLLHGALLGWRHPHALSSAPRAGLVSATPGGQRFHTWTGALSEPCRAWARYSERRMIETLSPAPASPAGTTYEKLCRVYSPRIWFPPGVTISGPRILIRL